MVYSNATHGDGREQGRIAWELISEGWFTMIESIWVILPVIFKKNNNELLIIKHIFMETQAHCMYVEM